MDKRTAAEQAVIAALTAYVNKQDEAIRPLLASYYQECLKTMAAPSLDSGKEGTIVAS